MPTYTDIASADAGGGLCRLVLRYSDIFKRLVDQAKLPGFTVDSWAPLAEMVAIDEFVRVGAFKEVVNWRQYAEILTGWARSAAWDCSFKRVSEVEGRVFLELEERSTAAGHTDVVNSMSVYAFNPAGKLSHLDIYLQRAVEERSTGGWESAGKPDASS